MAFLRFAVAFSLCFCDGCGMVTGTLAVLPLVGVAVVAASHRRRGALVGVPLVRGPVCLSCWGLFNAHQTSPAAGTGRGHAGQGNTALLLHSRVWVPRGLVGSTARSITGVAATLARILLGVRVSICVLFFEICDAAWRCDCIPYYRSAAQRGRPWQWVFPLGS